MKNNKQDTSKQYHFLHSHIEKEPHILEVLNEIDRMQKEFLQTYEGSLATLEALKKSKNIKMQISPARDKNIYHLVNLLRKQYPDEIAIIITYSFYTDTATKKLSIIEKIEYTVLLPNPEKIKIQSLRDKQSIESLLELISKYRFFNLTKLQKISKEKAHLAQLITSEMGKSIFTFKNHSIDRNNLESVDDFCFHQLNYDSVVKSLNIQNIQKIVSTHSKHIMARLKKFGILSTTFNDYRDNKLDYLLNILLEDISSFLGDKDLVEVKNFNSLRKCLLDFDQTADPIITISNDIIKHIREHEITNQNELIDLFDGLNSESLNAWAVENMNKHNILSHVEDGETYFIDYMVLFPRLTDLNNQILYKQENFDSLDHSEKQKKFSSFRILCNISKNILNSQDEALKVFNTNENIDIVKKIIGEFDDYQKRISIKSEFIKEKQTKKKKKSFFGAVINFIKLIFGIGPYKLRKKKKHSESGQQGHGRHHVTRISKDSKAIYSKIIQKQSKIIALSDYLEITSENDITIDSVINELRDKKKKIVIPIYNARDTLYPNRSAQYLISDIEYLMVDMDIAQSADSIRNFTDSLSNYKIKNEKMPTSAILSIEKYLLTLYRQKKKKKK